MTSESASERLRYLFLVISLIAITAPSTVSAAGWKMVFDDEFNAASLDRSVWATRYIYNNETLDQLNDEAEHYRDNDNHVMKDGALHLTARQTPRGWESGMIRSQQTFYYGYFEARVRFPKGRGVWPAFWLGPDYDIDGKSTWPPEIDIFEYVVNDHEDTNNMVHSSGVTVPRGAAVNYSYVDPAFKLRWMSYLAPAPLNADWHVFALLWLPNEFTVFLDGKKLYTRDYHWLDPKGGLAAPANILLNFALGGEWAGRYGIDDKNFPQSFDVDYVRVCQFSESNDAASSCPHDPRGPDLGNVRYQAPGDMKKPVVQNISLISPVTGAADASDRVSIASAATMKVQVSLANLTSVKTSRSLFVGLRASNSKNISASAYVALPDDVFRSDASRTVNAELVIPPRTPQGMYDLVVGLSTQDASGDHKAGSGQLTPVSCETQVSKMPKALLCTANQIAIGQ